MANFLKNRSVLLVVLLVFVLCKIPHLYYPYYWDESWPYAPAIVQMYHHGISLMPSAVDAELSRGHPLFFHAIAAAWMRLFGPSHVSMHSFALFISVLFLIAIYEAGFRLFNLRVAILSLLLVATQVMFFVQSSFVLLEVLVAFLAFLSICFYTKDKYLLTIICLTALFYTKESGLIVGFVLGLDALVRLFSKETSVKIKVYRLLSIALPCLFMGLFFLLQKHLRGWYIFPLYAEIIEHSWPAFWYKFRMACVHVVFYDGLRFYYFLPLLALAVAAAVKNKNLRYLAILLPAGCIYYFVNDMRAGRLLPPVPFFIVFLASVFYLLYVYGGRQFFMHAYQRRFIVLSGIFILCFLCFSTMNFFTPRYLLAIIIPALVLVAVFADMLIAQTYKPLYYPVLAVVLLISFCAFKADTDHGDVNIGAFTGMDIQQDVVAWLEHDNDYDKNIGTGSFLEQQHLINPGTGFLSSTKIFTNIKWSIDHTTDIAIFDNVEPDDRYSTVKKDSTFYCAFRIQKNDVWAEIYKHK